MLDLADWFMTDMPEFQVSGGYDKEADLGCTDQDKKE